MPVKECNVNSKPGYKWGDAGKCYPYEPGNESSRKAAKSKALKQGLAIGDIGSTETLKELEKENI